jgi:hypothetical protein
MLYYLLSFSTKDAKMEDEQWERKGRKEKGRKKGKERAWEEGEQGWDKEKNS